MTAQVAAQGIGGEAIPRRKRRRPVRVAVNLMPDGEKVERVVEGGRTDEESEALQLVEDMSRVYARRLRDHFRFYHDDPEAADKAEKALQNISRRDGQLREEVADKSPHALTWNHLNALAAEDMKASLETWGRIRLEANEERVTGKLAAAGVRAGSPMELARFYAVRDAFLDEWQPRGGIETAMIDTLAQTFSLYLYWTQIAHARATGLCENIEEMTSHETWNKWKIPYEAVREQIEQAHQMADRWNRMFLRTLRGLRDLRRYPSVIVNNGGQVNVAQNQVNAQKVG